MIRLLFGGLFQLLAQCSDFIQFTAKSQCFQQFFHQTKTGQTRLKQVKADEEQATEPDHFVFTGG